MCLRPCFFGFDRLWLQTLGIAITAGIICIAITAGTVGMGGVLLMSVPAFIISVPVSHTMLQKEWEAAAQEEWENNPPVTTGPMLTASKPEDPHPADFAAQKADDERLRRSERSCFLCVLLFLCDRDGLWEADKMHGQGKYTFVSGDVYEGQWEADTKHGQGKYTAASGEVYEGQWKAGKKHGQGKNTSASGNVYEGRYEAGKRMG